MASPRHYGHTTRDIANVMQRLQGRRKMLTHTHAPPPWFAAFLEVTWCLAWHSKTGRAQDSYCYCKNAPHASSPFCSWPHESCLWSVQVHESYKCVVWEGVGYAMSQHAVLKYTGHFLRCYQICFVWHSVSYQCFSLLYSLWWFCFLPIENRGGDARSWKAMHRTMRVWQNQSHKIDFMLRRTDRNKWA